MTPSPTKKSGLENKCNEFPQQDNFETELSYFSRQVFTSRKGVIYCNGGKPYNGQLYTVQFDGNGAEGAKVLCAPKNSANSEKFEFAKAGVSFPVAEKNRPKTKLVLFFAFFYLCGSNLAVYV